MMCLSVLILVTEVVQQSKARRKNEFVAAFQPVSQKYAI